MKEEDIPEEHRKYLDLKDNPKQVSNTSIFALLSDVRVSIGKVETKQENIEKGIGYVDKKIDKLDDSVNNKIDVLEDDLKQCQIGGIGTRAGNEEKFIWIAKVQKVLVALSLATVSLILYLHFGISFP